MQGSSEDSSTRSVEPQISSKATLARERPVASLRRHHFASPTVEEELTYRYWRRATLVFYAIFLCGIAAIVIAIGPIDKSNGAKQDVYSALASAVQRSAH
jgi:hypothetical protein